MRVRGDMRFGLTVAVCLCTFLVSARSTYACHFEGKDAYLTVAVSASQRNTFQLRIHGMPVTADLGDSSGPSTHAGVAVDGALSFKGTTPVSSISVYLSRTISAGDGVVRLAAGKSVGLIARAPGETVAARIELDDAWIPRLSIPCDALTLDQPKRDSSVEDINLSRQDADWLPRRDSLVFHARPQSREGILVTINDRDNFLLAQIEAAGDHLHVGWLAGSSWAWGVSLSGWVSKRDVRAMPKWRRGPAGLGSHRTKSACPAPTYAYRGPATIKPGTRVYSQPGVGAWATINDPRGAIVAARHLDDDWFSLVELPGVGPDTKCYDLEHAWVPRSAVTIPATPPDSGGA